MDPTIRFKTCCINPDTTIPQTFYIPSHECAKNIKEASLRMREAYSKLNIKREENKVKMIQYQKPRSPAKCSAVTLQGTPCPFKAVCGKFCSRHTINNL